MNECIKRVSLRVALLAFFISVVALVDRIRKDPEMRAGIAWAVRSWITPPDADAGWQQNLSGRRAWHEESRG